MTLAEYVSVASILLVVVVAALAGYEIGWRLCMHRHASEGVGRTDEWLRKRCSDAAKLLERALLDSPPKTNGKSLKTLAELRNVRDLVRMTFRMTLEDVFGVRDKGGQ